LAAPARSPSGARDGPQNEAKRRRAPVEAPDRAARAAREPGGGSTRRWKAPWSDQAVAFDEAAVEAGLAVRGSGGRPKGGRRGRRVATEGVRGHVACSVRGREHRDRERLPEGLSIAAPPGPGGAVLGWHATTRRSRQSRSWRVAVKRSSTRPGMASARGSGRRRAGAVPEGREAPREAPGNRWIRRVLVT
jgi:hypothetical protein